MIGNPLRTVFDKQVGRYTRLADELKLILMYHLERERLPIHIITSRIKTFDSFVDEAQAILDECGRPREQMVGAPPMHFLQECVPRIQKFHADVTKAIDELVPEFMGRFRNVGNVTHNTDDKPAMIQQVERWLENLKWIEDELRKRLDP